MATYAFETITAAQALAIQPGDTLTFVAGTSRDYSVLYGPNSGEHTVVFGARQVTFGGGFDDLTRGGRTVFADGSVLYVGDAVAETFAVGSNASAAVYGGDGADSLQGGLGPTFIHGNQGNDLIAANAGGTIIFGGQGDDDIRLSGGGSGNFLHGNLGDDTVGGGTGADTLLGGQHNDRLDGRGSGADYLTGDLGNDTIFGGGAGSRLMGADGSDILHAGWGLETLAGGSGADTLLAETPDLDSAATQFMDGGAGDDKLIGYGDNADTLIGGEGADTIFSVEFGLDLIEGGPGDDNLHPGQAGNVVRGGPGNDNIGGGWGADTLSGGDGADHFSFTPDDSRLNARDRIIDWEATDEIVIANQTQDAGMRGYAELTAGDEASALAVANAEIDTGRADFVAVQVGQDVHVFLDTWEPAAGAEGCILLVGRTLADVSAEDFR